MERSSGHIGQDTRMALDLAQHVWQHGGPEAAAAVLAAESNFLAEVWGEDWAERPLAQQVLGIPHRPANRNLHLYVVAMQSTRRHLQLFHGIPEIEVHPDLTSTPDVAERHVVLHGGIITPDRGIRWVS